MSAASRGTTSSSMLAVQGMASQNAVSNSPWRLGRLEAHRLQINDKQASVLMVYNGSVLSGARAVNLQDRQRSSTQCMLWAGSKVYAEADGETRTYNR